MPRTVSRHHKGEVCSFCTRKGHDEDSCPDRKCEVCKDMGHSSSVCVYRLHCDGCEKRGHLQKDCKVICPRCNKRGHIIALCKEVICSGCGAFGHFQKDCAEQGNPTGVPPDPHEKKPTRTLCYRCRGEGHFARDCTVPVCAACHKVGHSQHQCFARCFRCNKTGHLSAACTEKLVCNFCKVGNHLRKDCPDYVEYIKQHECDRCGERGHTERRCNNPYIRNSAV